MKWVTSKGEYDQVERLVLCSRHINPPLNVVIPLAFLLLKPSIHNVVTPAKAGKIHSKIVGVGKPAQAPAVKPLSTPAVF